MQLSFYWIGEISNYWKEHTIFNTNAEDQAVLSEREAKTASVDTRL